MIFETFIATRFAPKPVTASMIWAFVPGCIVIRMAVPWEACLTKRARFANCLITTFIGDSSTTRVIGTPVSTAPLWVRSYGIKPKPFSTATGLFAAQSPAGNTARRSFGTDGIALVPTSGRRRGKRYRYYTSNTALKKGYREKSSTPCPSNRWSSLSFKRLVDY